VRAQLGDTTGALEAYERSEQLDPKYWRTPMSRGLLLERMGRLKEALAALEKAARISPDAPELRGALDRVRAALGDY
jgi:cytochrome c-type biogenesis protein CcmH/NrfG